MIAFILATMRAGLPARAAFASLPMYSIIALCRAEGGLQEAAQLGRGAEARELHEDAVHVLADVGVRGEEAVVGVDAGGAGVVVAGAEVGVALEARPLAPHHEQHLRVGLVADDAVDDVGAASWRREASEMFASSSKRARSSTTTVTSLPARAAVTRESTSTDSGPVR